MDRTFTRTAFALFLIGGLNFLAGLLFLAIVAGTYGTGSSLEAFYMAEAVPGFLNTRLLFGAANIVLVPLLCAERLRKNAEESWDIASNFISVLTILGVFYTTVVCVFAPGIIKLIAPGFDASQAALAVNLLRLLSFTTLLSTATAWMRGVLHAHNVFLIPHLAGVIYFVFLAVFVLLGSHGMDIWALGIGTVLGSVLYGLIHVVPLRKIRMRLRFRIEGAVVRGPLLLFFSYLLVSTATHINYLVDRYFASRLAEGSIVILTLAQKFEIPITFLVTVSVSVPALTVFSNAVGNEGEFRTSLRNSIRAMSALALPFLALLLVLRLPLVRIWFEHGAFTHQDSLKVSSVVSCLALSFFVNVYAALLLNGYFSLRAVKLCIAMIVGEVLLNIYLTYLLVGPLGLEGIALATSLSAFLANLVLWTALRSRLKGLGFKENAGELGRLAAFCLLTVSGTFLLRHLLHEVLPGYFHRHPIQDVMAIGSLSVLLFSVVGHVFRIPEAKEFLRILRTLLGAIRKGATSAPEEDA